MYKLFADTHDNVKSFSIFSLFTHSNDNAAKLGSAVVNGEPLGVMCRLLKVKYLPNLEANVQLYV